MFGNESYSGTLDIPDLSIAIMLGIDSSKIKATQRVGRVARKFGNKQSEIFNIVIKVIQTIRYLFGLGKI